jgi:proliferating cell nuclear antigen PCNA
MRIVEVKTVQANVMKILSEALKDLVPDINLVFTKQETNEDEEGNAVKTGGISAITMAMSNNVLLHLKLDAANFDYFFCARDKFVAGINTSLLFKVMKTMNNNDTITLFVDEEDENKLGIKFENKQNNFISTKRLNLFDIDEYEIEIPPTKFNTVINMPSPFFNKIIRDLNSLGDVVEVKSICKKLILNTLGETVGDEIEIGESDNGVTIVTEDNNLIFQGNYDLRYLNTFCKCTNLCANVDIFMKNDYPLVIRYFVASLGTIYLCLSSKTDPSSLEYDDDDDDEEEEEN